MLPVYVVGSGIAGLRFSLDLAETRPVVLLTKKAAVESNTNHAQGGIAAAFGDDDSLELHYKDTIECGAGLCDEAVVQMVVSEGPPLVRELMDIGAQFAQSTSGQLKLGREGGHSRNRVVHSGDATGREIERVLLESAEAHPNISLRPYHFVVDIIVDENSVKGIIVLDPDEKLHYYPAGVVCLSSGGVGRVFQYTTNPSIATGDGIAMGYRAGAKIRDMEFIQFHPTALARPGSNAFLISEAVRGEGATLKNLGGERFMARYDKERMELAPRDVVARAIDCEMKRTNTPHVLLDVTHHSRRFLSERFPTIFSTCLLHGIQIDRQSIPVVPAAHYSCGGLMTDHKGRTSVKGLYAIGETASHGLHGANRLASNSLLEALVFARRGSASAANEPEGTIEIEERLVEPSGRKGGLTGLYAERLRTVMSQNVGIFRTRKSLLRASLEIGPIATGVRRIARIFSPEQELFELANMARTSELIVASALRRNESRGLHAMEDFPNQKSEAIHTILQKDKPSPLVDI